MKPIVITGFMGCGKTEIARALARGLDRVLVDLDEKIFEQHGRTAAQLIVEEGEAAFRRIETATLRELLTSGTAGIVALGGGAWITEANRDLVREHGAVSVWLDVPFETCWERIVASTEDRPLGRTREQAHELYNLRRPIYKLAIIHLSIRAADSVDSILARLESRLPKSGRPPR